MVKLLDISKDLKAVDRSTLQLGSSFATLSKSSKAFGSGLNDVRTALNSNQAAAVKASSAFKALGAAGGAAATGLFELADVGGKIGALATIAGSAYGAFVKLSGVSRTLRFEEAILGTNKLSENFEFLEQTSNKTIDTIRLGFQAAFDSSKFEQFSGKAVAAYAPVEQAAYRLSTVTVAAGERSIDALGKNVQSMRKLQAATKDALGSVELLNAQYDIASAGFTTPQANLDVGEASINLSQAGFGDLAGSTNATVRVLRALGDESSKADLRASQLFETTRVGLVTLDQLTPIIGSLSVQSKQLGVDFAEVAASVAGLTTQGASAGEAGTRLEALFGEIVNAAPAANKILSEFRDEAGKPIQLNASALKTKGIRGIVKDIQAATGGDVAKISQLFSTKEATEAVQLLISLGDKAFKEYTDRIKNVNTEDLGKEAEGRTKTISGAFSQAQNIGQRQVEDFGSGAAKAVVEDVLNANKTFKGFITGSAEGIGRITGTIGAISEKVKAIGGGLFSAFSAVAPFAFFAVVSSKIKKIGTDLKKEAKNGETIWDVVKRKAIDAFADIYTKWVSTMNKIKAKAQSTGKEIEKALNNKAESGKATQLSLFDIEEIPNTRPKSNLSTKSKQFDTPELNKVDTSDLKSVRKKSFGGSQLELDFSSAKPKGLKNIGDSFKSFKTSATGTFNTVKSVSSTAFTGIGKAAGLAAPFLKSAAVSLGGVGLAAGAMVAAGSIAAGWIDTLGSLLDKRTNPALQQMVENLKDVKNVEGLEKALRQFDETATSVESTSYASNVLNESLTRAGGLWDIVTGASTKFNAQTKPELEKINSLLEEQITKNRELASSGKLGTDTKEGKVAEDKLARGITLNSNDEEALRNEAKGKESILDKQIQNQELLVKQKAETDRYDTEGLEKEKQKLSALKARAAEEKKTIQNALDSKLVQQQIERFKNIDTTIPISVQLQEQSTQSIKAQIKDIKDTLNTPTGDIFGDPAKYAAQFGELSKKLGATIDAIQVEVEIDANNAEGLRDKLVSEVGEENFNKLIASNPALRQKFSDTNKSITGAKTAQTKLTETADTSILDAAQSSGSESTALAAEKYAAQTKSINAQVKVLNSELNRPETTLNRQREIVAEIEGLEASRLKLDIDGKISKELGSRKQQLSLDQEMLNVKKATLNLFSQESQFGSLAVTAAQAKLQAAKQELAFKKEQIAISGKEELIKKETIADGVQKRGTRATEQASAGLGADFRANDPNLKQKLDEKKNQFESVTKEQTTKQVEVIEGDRTRKLEEVDKKSKVFSADEQKKVLDAYGQNEFIFAKTKKEDLFDAEGKLKDEKAVTRKLTSNKLYADGLSRFDDSKQVQDANKLLTDKGLEGIEGKARVNKEADQAVKDAQTSGQQAIEKRSSLLDAVEQRVLNGLGDGSKSKVETKPAEKKDVKSTTLPAPSVSGKLDSEAVAGASSVASKSSATPTQEVPSTTNKAPATATAEVTTSAKETTPEDDVKFTKAINAVKDKLGTLAERISVNEAKIELEFAGREKLIKRGELLGNSLSELASKSSLFAGTFAGASLSLASAKLNNKPERLQKEADLEIAKINQKVKDLAQNAADAAEAASIAKSSGADEKTVKKLDEQAADARKLSQGAEAEKLGDIEFVKQKTAVDKLTASLDIAEAKINKEFAGRERLAEQANQLADGFSKLGSSSLFSGSIAQESLQVSSIQAKQNSGAIDTKADKDLKLVDERVKALRELAKQNNPAGEEARKDLAKVEQEALSDKELIQANRGIEKLGLELELAAAQIEQEYGARERLSQQTSELSEGFSRLSGSALLSGSASSADLKLTSTTLAANSGQSDIKADKAIAGVEARLEKFRALSTQDTTAGKEAKANLSQVEDEAQKQIGSINSTRAFENISGAFEVATAQVEKEYASRSRLVDINDSLASSFSSLAGTIGNLFKNSSIGASIARFGVELANGSGKARLEYDKQNALLEKRSQELAKAVTSAQKDGASAETIDGLKKAKQADDAQKGVEQGYLRQKLTLDSLTQKFALLSSKSEEVSDKLAKQADLIKQGIELEDRKRSSALENNKSGVGLQSALVGFLGKNNPVSAQLLQRLEVQQARDDAKGQQAQNVSDTKKELIDLNLQKSQLDLEQRAYENAITQTALLSDILAVNSGGNASTSKASDIQAQVANLPKLFAQGKEQAAARSSLLDSKLAFIPEELDAKNRNIKRNLLANELGALGGNLNPANIDLIQRSLSDTESELKQFKRQDFKVGSLSDKEFTNQLRSLGVKELPKPSRQDYLVDNTVRRGANAPTASNVASNQAFSINAPIKIQLDVKGGAIDPSLQRQLINTTSTQVNTALTKLGQEVKTYAKRF